MTTKIPPYNFTVDSKKHPNVPKIIDMAVRKMRMSRSEFVCKAIEEWYTKRMEQQHLSKNILLGGGEGGNNYNALFASIENMHVSFEALLPLLTEPLSRFRYESNRDMYHLMREELLTHIEEVGHLLTDGVSKTRQKFEKGFDERYDPRIRSIQEKEFPTTDEKVTALKTASREKIESDHMLLLNYITNQIKNYRQVKTSEQRYLERISDLKEEIRKLSSSTTKQEEQQQQQMKEKAELEQDIKAKEILSQQRSSNNNPTTTTEEDREEGEKSIESDIAKQV